MKKSNLMSAREYRSTLTELGLGTPPNVEDAQALGDLIGVHERTVRKWYSGDRAISPHTARFLRLVRKLGIKRARQILDGDELS
jgi:hypothetical protein